eukprot:CAMPEP_0175050468 /NCGR_PEP_ID=MMETSP0052_2-20121109/7275_1 /TAXON_ID=51329 ORGANISM="Polytomella parva, Strain SAG 63-3" /NCGR_SAMPLE_ID=MMETSP0052_2 /ASSEMBLY_ACC=CAM_ASM_000194 /LENGTH=861 /DNA_ID=CAMNT_0016314673 /DNA_START=726 /DNA_END=3311 /DNA_ORIENTATION=+
MNSYDKTKLNDVILDPEDPSDWLKYMTDEGKWYVPRCAGYCDDVTGLCYCGMGPYRYRKPPPGSPADAMGSGRLIGHQCRPKTNDKGQAIKSGTFDWEDLYGPKGYCMLLSNHSEWQTSGAVRPNMCGCDFDGTYGNFCSQRKEVFCINNCNGHGICERGFCKCLPGWYGADCVRRRAGLPLLHPEVEESVRALHWMKPGFSPTRALGQSYNESVWPSNWDFAHAVFETSEGRRQDVDRSQRRILTEPELSWGTQGKLEDMQRILKGTSLATFSNERKEQSGVNSSEKRVRIEMDGADDETVGESSVNVESRSEMEEWLLVKRMTKHASKDVGEGKVYPNSTRESARDSRAQVTDGNTGDGGDDDSANSIDENKAERPSTWSMTNSNASFTHHSPPPANRMRPLIYVYDMAETTSQILQYGYSRFKCAYRHFGADSNITVLSNTVYDVESLFHEMLMTSEHRTFDPDEADFFYVPIYQGCFMHPALNFAEQPMFPGHLSSNRAFHATYMYHAAYKRVRHTFPFWNKTNGKDHIFMAFHDEGACYLPHDVYTNSTILTSWGRLDLDHRSHTAYVPDNYSDVLHNQYKGWRQLMSTHPCYDPAKDLVIPSFKSPHHFIYSPMLGFPPMKRDILLYLKGNLGSHRLPWYSRGIRQSLYRLSKEHDWSAKHRIYLIESEQIEGYEVDPFFNKYSHQLARSKFCVVAPGDGFSSRLEDAVLHGCIPIIFQDRVHVAFESILDIDSFAVRMSESAINAYLPYVLKGISDEQVERMQRRLAAVYHRFVYSGGTAVLDEMKSVRNRIHEWLMKQPEKARVHYSPMGHPFERKLTLSRHFDAFHTILQWLRWRREQLERQGELPTRDGKM